MRTLEVAKLHARVARLDAEADTVSMGTPLQGRAAGSLRSPRNVPDLLKRCHFAVGANVAVRKNKDAALRMDETSNQSTQYHQRFVEVM